MKQIFRIALVGTCSAVLAACFSPETYAAIANGMDGAATLAEGAGAFGIPYLTLIAGALGGGAEFLRGYFVDDKKQESAGALYRATKAYLDSLPAEDREAAKKFMYEKLEAEVGAEGAQKANDYLQVAKSHKGTIRSIIEHFLKKK